MHKLYSASEGLEVIKQINKLCARHQFIIKPIKFDNKEGSALCLVDRITNEPFVIQKNLGEMK